MTTKNNIYKEHLPEWLKAKKDKKKRGEIVDNICFIAGVHPKSVQPCAENLHGVLHDYVRIPKRDNVWNQSEEVTTKLLAMSLGTMKKRVAKFKKNESEPSGKSREKKDLKHLTREYWSEPT